ncbi:MAG: epoxyqueuosine reductase [Candidatus Brocadiaceae bacterium]|nr:epoxyqueuosine reductase [Candidatus Brocadiaceae bacterium]
MDKLSAAALELPLLEGAAYSGIVTTEGLSGGPPSVDLTYVLEGARSAISFAVAMDKKSIPPYFMKENRHFLEKEMIRANALASGIALHLSNYIKSKGYKSVPVAANLVYRDSKGGKASYEPTDEVHPDLAHRYLAIRSGLGHLGKSGNLITPEHGASVILAAVVTEAQLEPTPPLPAEDSYCDECKLCLASCASGFMDFSKDASVSLGGEEYTYSARNNFARCDLVCSGYTGLAKTGRWSTWSPGRFKIPEKDEDLNEAHKTITAAYAKWPETSGGRLFFYTDEKLRVSCAHCQLICDPDPDERKRRMKMLKNSGVVMQAEDGSLEAVTPKEAKQRLAKMPAEKKALYEGEV